MSLANWQIDSLNYQSLGQYVLNPILPTSPIFPQKHILLKNQAQNLALSKSNSISICDYAFSITGHAILNYFPINCLYKHTIGSKELHVNQWNKWEKWAIMEQQSNPTTLHGQTYVC